MSSCGVSDDARCAVCGERITMTGWTPFCCEVEDLPWTA